MRLSTRNEGLGWSSGGFACRALCCMLMYASPVFQNGLSTRRYGLGCNCSSGQQETAIFFIILKIFDNVTENASDGQALHFLVYTVIHYTVKYSTNPRER